jgi:tripartite-type tricarboxylate transporter receptor subunit TctC
MTLKTLRRARALIAIAATLSASLAWADSYPSKPVKMIVPFAAGGATDIIGRFVADRLSRELGQPFVVDNRAGANGAIGAEAVARSPADGYTLLVVTAGTHAINKSLYKSLSYDPVKDFTHVALVANAPNAVVVHPSVPAKNIRELIDYAKKNPGKLYFGSAGSGSTLHLAGELFNTMAGVQMVHVPYKGGSAAIIDLLGGRIQLMFDSISPALPNIQAGRTRVLAVTGAKRTAILPDVPTVAEAGLPGDSATAWFGIVAPANLPAEVTKKLNAAINRIISTEEARQQLTKLGGEPFVASPEEFRAHVQSEVAKWAKVVEASGAQAD